MLKPTKQRTVLINISNTVCTTSFQENLPKNVRFTEL